MRYPFTLPALGLVNKTTRLGSPAMSVSLARTILAISVLVLFAFSMAVPLLSTVGTATAATNSNNNNDPSGTLTQTSSGLNHEDSLIGSADDCTGGNNDTSNINTNYWTIYGDAVTEAGASWTACEGVTGLWLGAQSGGSPDWAGIYAESPNAHVMLYHTNLFLPAKTIQDISSDAFNTGLYVQTSKDAINYTSCYGQVMAGGKYYWGVELATGNANSATKYSELYVGPTYTNGGPSSEDCTIVTNGSNLLQVYFNGTLVYSNTKDDLSMPEPFNAYLEVETSDTAQMLWATYADYYATTSNVVTVQNVPAGDIAEIVSGSTVYASATNTGDSAATLTLDIAKYNMPLAGVLEVLSGGSVIATSGSTSFWGGDVYEFSGSATSTSTMTSTTPTAQGTSALTVDSVNTLGNPLTGYYTELHNSGGGVISTGYTPIVYTLNDGVGYKIEADNYGACTFSQWSGDGLTGSTQDPAPITITSATTLYAVYSGSKCGPQTTTTTASATSATTTSTTSTTTATATSRPPQVTVESVNQNGAPITGYWTVLRTSSGSKIASGYTTKTFTSGMTVGSNYEIELDGYGSCTFSHWQGTSNSGDLTFTAAGGSQTFVGVFDCT
jgi:hypothetical protein